MMRKKVDDSNNKILDSGDINKIKVGHITYRNWKERGKAVSCIKEIGDVHLDAIIKMINGSHESLSVKEKEV